MRARQGGDELEIIRTEASDNTFSTAYKDIFLPGHHTVCTGCLNREKKNVLFSISIKSNKTDNLRNLMIIKQLTRTTKFKS